MREASFHSKKNYYLRVRRQRHFINSPWAGGVLLVVFAIVAMVLANAEATKAFYHHILQARFTVGFADSSLAIVKSVEEWVNDGLMVLFFFVVGLEIKREVIAGQLSTFKQASLPVAAALGGMVVPALIYAAFNHGTPTAAGWGIPMATDIAFAIGILSLLGRRVPLSMKIFLTALAIADDLGAILVIAFFYSSQIDLVLLGCSAGVLLLMLWMNRMNVYSVWYYLVPSVLLWVLFLYSGVHSTIAGVLIAMLLPATPRHSKKYFSYKVHYYLESFRFHDRPGVEVLSNHTQHDDVNMLRQVAKDSISPSQRMEHALYNFVTFFVMPLFALVNAGVEIGGAGSLSVFSTSLGTGIFLGLVIGKPLGIMLLSWIMVRTGVSVMPQGANWKILAGVACLGGIGFTMSIFVDNLAFGGTAFVDTGKIAVLASSVAASLLGALMVNLAANVPADDGIEKK
ncbi:MAG: Na+/H+ antiporter NhaA [Rikenellaceae bacterium]|jgi:NhaA family Na+:H+ antiporter|nr:Na+/H+ antiporter NhaA [Rikenellaceae bacterium]